MTTTAGIPHRAVARWANVLCEPLSSDRDRAHASLLMREHIETRVPWAVAYMAGVIRSLIQTLPSEDPWRHLATRVTGTGGETDVVRNLPNRAAPLHTGAIGAFGQFGSIDDALDMVDTGMKDRWVDPNLTALTPSPARAEDFDDTPTGEYLHPVAAALVGFGATDYDTMYRACLAAAGTAMGHRPDGTQTGVMERLEAVHEWVDHCTQAIRWAAFRRRCYEGAGDTFLHSQLLSWIADADQVYIDEWTPDINDHEIAEAHVGDGEYTRYMARRIEFGYRPPGTTDTNPLTDP